MYFQVEMNNVAKFSSRTGTRYFQVSKLAFSALLNGAVHILVFGIEVK